MADFRAGSWTHPSGGFRAGAAAFTGLGNQLAGAAAAAATATAAMTTGAGFSGFAAVDATASGTLVNWLPVTVASPDTNPGSIFDARWWTGAAPANGDLIRHEDRGGFEVAPNGQYSATSYGSYLVRFAYASAPTVWYETIVEIIQTDLAGDASAQAAASGTLSDAAGNSGLAGSAAGVATAGANLATGIPLQGAAQGQAGASGSLGNAGAPGGAPVLSLPGDLYVTIPVEMAVLYKDHTAVLDWLAAATATTSDGVSPVSLAKVCPDVMLLSDSPVTVTFTATDEAGNQASDTRRIYIQQSTALPVDAGAGQMFRYVNGQHVYVGRSDDSISRLIDT